MHIRAFYTDFNIEWDLIFFIASSLLETKYIEVKIFVLHKMCVSILVAFNFFSKIVLGGAR